MAFPRLNYKILFLCFVVFGTYYPAIFADLNLVDDFEVFGRLSDLKHFHILNQFIDANDGYYRPLTTLTFFFDKVFWDLEPSFMHLENIIFHVLNALLVFLIAEKVLTTADNQKFELPLLSGLLFALHPVNAEAVNWISGRFDLLATSFVLCATLLILQGAERRQNRYFILAALMLFIGCFAKESVLFFFPAALFFALLHTEDKQKPYMPASLLKSIPFFVVLISYLLFRFVAAKSADTGVARVAEYVARSVTHDVFNTVRITLKVFGFYVKKLFIPMPLNFAIISVSDIYFWVGLIAAIAALFLLVQRNRVIDYFLVSLSLISSGIAVVFAGIAWTPVAERYLYLPSAFFSISCIGIAFLILKRYRKETWITAVALIFLFGAAFITAERTLVWQDNLTLYEDTARKSPKFSQIKSSLAGALKEKGKISDADDVLVQAIHNNPNQANLYINRADMWLKQGDVNKAREIILSAFKEKKSAKADVLKMLARIDEKRLWNAAGNKAMEDLATADLVDTYDILFKSTHEALFAYRNGQFMLARGDKKRAANYFQCAYEAAPEGTYFKAPAKKLAEKLGKTVK